MGVVTKPSYPGIVLAGLHQPASPLWMNISLVSLRVCGVLIRKKKLQAQSPKTVNLFFKKAKLYHPQISPPHVTSIHPPFHELNFHAASSPPSSMVSHTSATNFPPLFKLQLSFLRISHRYVCYGCHFYKGVNALKSALPSTAGGTLYQRALSCANVFTFQHRQSVCEPRGIFCKI